MAAPLVGFMGYEQKILKEMDAGRPMVVGDLLATITCLVVGILGVCGTIPMGHAAGGVLIGVSCLIVALYIIFSCKKCAEEKGNRS
jgi:hypothetical protein